MTVRELLRVPDPLDTLEGWYAFTGRDVARFDTQELKLERSRVRYCLLILDDRPASWRERRRLAWLHDRLVRVEHRAR